MALPALRQGPLPPLLPPPLLLLLLLALGLPQSLGSSAGQVAGHGPRDRHADEAGGAQLGPLPAAQQLQQKQDKKLHHLQMLHLSRTLGPRLRRQLRFSEEDDDDEMDAVDRVKAAERWLLMEAGPIDSAADQHQAGNLAAAAGGAGGGAGGGGLGPGGGAGGRSAPRSLAMDDFPPPPPHPKHLLYNAVLPSQPTWRKRDGGLRVAHGGYHGHHYEDDDMVNHHMLRTTRGNRQYDVPQIGECEWPLAEPHEGRVYEQLGVASLPTADTATSCLGLMSCLAD